METTSEATVTESAVATLLRQAYLFDDPRAYEAGVLDAVEALAAVDERAPQQRSA